MRNAELNLEKLKVVATALDHLLPQLTFVGGCTTVLLVDEVAASGVRYTEDVDVIVDITTAANYLLFSSAIRTVTFPIDVLGQQGIATSLKIPYGPP